LIILSLAAVVAACSSAAVSTVEPGTATPSETAAATAEPTASPTAEPTAADTAIATDTPAPTTKTFVPGDEVTVTQNGEPYLKIVVSKVSQHFKYGAFYIQAFVTYTSLADGATYDAINWQVHVRDVATDNPPFATSARKPELHSGTLPKGRKVGGWVEYEVPPRGKVVMSYSGGTDGNEAPVFEVVIRPK